MRISKKLDIESVLCNIQYEAGLPILIGTCYRPPNSSDTYNNKIIDMLTLVGDTETFEVVIMGDFNLSGIDFNTLSTTSTYSELFLEKTLNLFLTQHVSFPTINVTGGIGSTIDLVFTDEEQSVSEQKQCPPLGKSDHICITFNVNIPCKRHCLDSQPKDLLNYWKGNNHKLNAKLNI